ncbi:Yip1 family protein [Dethiosulfatarculus sandiegensis]|nr:Yip1 family protein [Dethiosulfatarculus sandiegensis]
MDYQNQSPGQTPPPPPPPPNSNEAGLLPWEKEQGTVWDRLWQTWQLVMFKPALAFGPLSYFDWRLPLAFAAIVTLAQMVISLLFSGMGGGFSYSLTSIIFRSLFLLAVGLPILSGLLMFFLGLFGAKTTFSPIFRLVCYSNAASILTLIPVVGPFANLGWSIYILMNGTARLTGMPPGKTALPVIIAIFAPLLLLVVPIMLMFVG